MKHRFFHKKNQYQMDIGTANAALQNIFAACDKAPNTIPFDKIVLRQKANTKSIHILLVITAVLFIFTFVSPLVIPPLTASIETLVVGEPAVLVKDYLQDNILYLEFSGDHILFEQAYAETPDGTIIKVLSCDKEKKLICFPYDTATELNIYIPVRYADTLHFLLTPAP